ncbi:MAG: S49 family peptidase [Cyanobacteria bacterium]|nr:S49 family peptidase [Cyanobacteriota bacterium]MDA0866894.1 S49 family peptidase [Cyanobacteriota bacterium]
MNRFKTWTLTTLGAIALTLGISACGGGPEDSGGYEPLTYDYVTGDDDSDNYLLQIHIDGIILNSPAGSGLFGVSGVTYGYELQEILEKASEDDQVKGIFLRLSTPGGTVVGSDAIYQALAHYKETTGNPIVAYVEGLSASGGVWSMVAADVIYAAPGSIVGSIGVVGPTLLFFDDPVAIDGGLFGGGITTRNGIQQFAIAAGKGKDLGNPFRAPTEEELQVVQTAINNEYSNFVTHVATTRDIAEQTLREEMGAYIFDVETAEAYNLIDGTLGRPEALAELAQLAALEADYQLVQVSYPQPSLLNLLLGKAPEPLTFEQQQSLIQADLCSITTTSVLAYHGDITTLCPSQYGLPE